MKTKASTVIDGILIFVSFFAFSFIAISYFTRNVFAIVASSVCIAFLVLYLIKLKGSKKKLSAEDEQKLLTQFACFGSDYSSEIILNALKKRYDLIEKNGYTMINGKAVITNFSLTPLSEDIIPMLYSAAKNSKGVVLFTGNGLNKRASELIGLLPIKVKVLKINEVYSLLKNLESLPEIQLRLKKQRHGFKMFINEALKRERAKSFFVLALFLSFTAFFSSMSIYLFALAGVNLVLGVLSLCNIGDKFLKTKNSSGQN